VHLAQAGWLFSLPDSEGLSQESARKIKSLAIHIAEIENSSPYPLDWDLDRSGAENYPHHFQGILMVDPAQVLTTFPHR